MDRAGVIKMVLKEVLINDGMKEGGGRANVIKKWGGSFQVYRGRGGWE